MSQFFVIAKNQATKKISTMMATMLMICWTRTLTSFIVGWSIFTRVASFGTMSTPTMTNIQRMTRDLLQQSQDGFDESNRQLCDDLLLSLIRCTKESRPSKNKPSMDVESQKLIVRTLSNVSKSFRRYKRSNPEWKVQLDQISELVQRLESIQPHDNDDPSDDDQKPSPSGLPTSVAEYLTRLNRQKKELYKNPPVLPPHAVTVDPQQYPLPTRHKVDQTLQFVPGAQSDASTREFIHQFRPNLTPEEILRQGSFGGTYFRSIESAVTNQRYTSQQVLDTTVPHDWIQGLDQKIMLTSSTYRPQVNKYGVKCGGSLGMWESSGWISDVDPYGWFQWYCRFYQGRRCSDDGRQMARWLGVAGSRGRFKSQLCNKIIASNRSEAWKDANISPVIRQTLFHWGLDMTQRMVEQHSQHQHRRR